MKKFNVQDIFYDVLCIIAISVPALLYIIPWLLSANPSLGVDHYGGGSILMNKTLTEANTGYFSDWYIGANFALFPVRYIYWAVLKGLSFLSSNPFTIIKLSFSFTFFLSIITSYITIKKLYKNRIYGMLGSLLYVYAPYHMAWNGTEAVWSLSLYYAILPLAFYCFLEFIIELSQNKINNTKLLLSSLSLGLIMFTYPQSFLLLTFPFFAVFSILHALFNINKPQKKLVSTMKIILLSFLPIIIAFLIGAFWWLSALMQNGILTHPIQTIEVVLTKSPSFISIITLQGRAWTIPAFEHFFYSKSEIALAVTLAIIIWGASLYGVKECASRKMYWASATIISSFLFILLAMGPLSPIPIYTWFYNHVPLFSNIRTPDRWLPVIILSISFVFPSGIESISKILGKIPKAKFIGYCFIAALILANSGTELSYAFKNFNLNPDIYQHYEFLSSEPDGTRILTLPLSQSIKLDKVKNNIENDRNPFVIDPRLWTFMYGEKENFVGGSESLSIKELRERGGFQTILNDWGRAYSVNLDLIADVYGIDYLWIDKKAVAQDPRLFYYKDNSTIKSLETENYTLYKNEDPFPRIFILGENVTDLTAGWEVKEGNGTMQLMNSSNNSLKLQVNFFDENVREWRYVKYKEFVDVGMLDELYGEYSISGVDPQSIEFHLKFADENGRQYKWIKKLDTSNGSFRIPVFWFQPADKTGTRLEAKTIKLLKIGVFEPYINIKSKKEVAVELKNLTILKHQLINTPYQKIDDLKYTVRLPEINNYSKAILVFNYAYSSNIKLKLNDTVIDGYKIFGFLNGFEIPSGINSTQGTIEFKLGRLFYFSVALSLATLITACAFCIGNNMVKEV